MGYGEQGDPVRMEKRPSEVGKGVQIKGGERQRWRGRKGQMGKIIIEGD